MPLVNMAQRGESENWLGDNQKGDLDLRARDQQAMVAIKGPQELKRFIPVDKLRRHKGSGDPDFPGWPMFVTFSDPSDPKTVREVSPESIGVSRITIEITDEDVTTGIEKRLPAPTAKGFYSLRKVIDGRQVVAALGISNFTRGGQ